MNSVKFVVAAFLISSVAGHSVLTNLIVNGVAQTSCVRPQPSSNYDSPISDKKNTAGLQSAYMKCGWVGKTENAASKCPVEAGSKVGIQWHYTDNLSDKAALAADTYIIAPDHKGPCLVYMARSDTGNGTVWFKVFEDGYDSSTKQFCVDKLIKNKGIFEFTVPADLAPGNYLVRAELIALHEGFQLGGAQPYIHCAELTISGSGSSVPSKNLVSFPGAYKADDAGIYFNIYQSFKSYPIPGPALYVAGAVTPAPSTPVTPTPTPTPAPVGSSTTTTGKSSTTTTGRASSTTTTGRAGSTTTTGKASTPVPTPVPVPVTPPVVSTPDTPSASISGPCNGEGHMICASTSTYQTCTRGTWAAPQSCQTGLVCSPVEPYIYCL